MQNFVIFITLYIIFSLSNGFHATVIMAQSGINLKTEEEKSLASSFMAFMLLFGVFLGVFLAIPLGLLMDYVTTHYN
jgi:ABC-type nitrate/sulfonate/bicarbonate transport system permease component